MKPPSSNTLREIFRNKELASLGDAYINFVYSLALTEINKRPKAVKVSDSKLAEAFKQAGLREDLGTRVAKKDMANAVEALLIEAYRRGLLSINESVETLAKNSVDPSANLPELLKLAAERVSTSEPSVSNE